MADPEQQLRQHFGFDHFREGQEEVVSRLLEDKSVLAIFPTGAGKSLCYQLPALLLDGLTLVISPLIALMKDQVDFLIAKGIPAARLDSSLTREEYRKLFDDIHSGILKLLYISPERLGNERFLRTMARQRISLLAIDEAHCISEWGHNFRPDYLKIAQLARQLEVERTLALTATATPVVANDIRAAFDIAPDDEVHTGFYRPNLELNVIPCPGRDRDETLLAQIRKRPPGPTIVYVTLQRTAEQVAAYLSSNGINATAYHAGLQGDARASIQDTFMTSADGVIVATIAFGMGVDKADIRYIYHYNLPKGLESYSQEVGRAGRDGEASVCEMLACADDIATLENFSYGDTPEARSVDEFIRLVFDAGETFDLSEYELSGRFDIRPLVVKTLLTYLELEGYLVSTGPFYNEYKFQPLRPEPEIFARVSGERREFLETVFHHAKKGRVWQTLDTTACSEKIKQPRNRIVAALDYLEEKSDLLLQVSGLRQGYRRLRIPDQVDTFIETIGTRFQRRESNDMERIRQVVQFAQHDACLTQFLLKYFGEDRGDCGHCCRCRGEKPGTLEATKHPALSNRDKARIQDLVAGNHPSIRSPRQLARFLCGITSPATTAAKLRKKTGMFGAYDTMPFKTMLEYIEQQTSL